MGARYHLLPAGRKAPRGRRKKERSHPPTPRKPTPHPKSIPPGLVYGTASPHTSRNHSHNAEIDVIGIGCKPRVEEAIAALKQTPCAAATQFKVETGGQKGPRRSTSPPPRGHAPSAEHRGPRGGA